MVVRWLRIKADPGWNPNLSRRYRCDQLVLASYSEATHLFYFWLLRVVRYFVNQPHLKRVKSITQQEPSTIQTTKRNGPSFLRSPNEDFYGATHKQDSHSWWRHTATGLIFCR